MSEFVFLFRADQTDQQKAMGTPEHAQESMRAWLDWIRVLEAKGHLKDPGQPLDIQGKVVRGANKLITDGPYVETKDLVLGYLIIEAGDLAQATELSLGCPMLDGSGSVEIRPVASYPS
jgi:hypothetical protein